MRQPRRAAERPKSLRRKKKTGMSVYKRIVICILLFGGLFLGMKLYELWQIHQEMQITIRKEQELTEENQRLHDEKDRLSSPEEIERQAREQFGLAKPGEIPYRR